jgi:integrase
MRVLLTDRFVANAKSAGKRVEYFDATVLGLSLRVSDGAKTFAVTFTSPSDGKRARLTLGTYPATKLSEARARAVEARGCVERGEDPRLVFDAQAAGGMTMAMLIARYVEQHVRINLRGAAEVERRLSKNVVLVIGSVRLADLHRRDINRAVDAVVKRGKLTEANRVFEDLRATLRWAVARGDLDYSLMDGMSKPAAANIRERVLSDDEVRRLWQGLPDALPRSKSVQRIIKLCLITGQRVGEVAGMRRDELDLKSALWSLPGARTKNGHPHNVPLSALAIEIIREALGEAEKGAAFLFPAGDGSLAGAAVARTILRAHESSDERPDGRFGIAHWSAHDLRRTALTGMARLGVAPIVLGHVANHRTTTRAGVTLAVYSKYQYDGEKAAALNLWAERLIAIISSEPAANIIPLRAG